METREYLENEIINLTNLEGPASILLRQAQIALNIAKAEFKAAKDELESLRICRNERIWELEHFVGAV